MTGEADRGRPGRGTWGVVLFDLDGTLADTVPLILRCYRHTMTRHLGAPPPDEEWLRGIGRPLRDQLVEFARDDEEAAGMLDTWVTFQRTVHDAMVRPFPGAGEVVHALKARGALVGVVTSKRDEMARRTLDHLGLLDAMDVLVTADDV
ncbi:MAG TPA: HAD hydrolase-like protein, partial [Longimicrobiales bacterium]